MKEMFLKNKKRFIIGSVILLLMVIAAVVYGRSALKKGAQNSPAPQADAALTGQDYLIDAWGEVKYGEVYDISIDFPSIVTDVNVREGDHVTLGQKLVTLDMSEYFGIVSKLEQQLTIAQADLLTINQDLSALEADIAQTSKDVRTKTQKLNDETDATLSMLKTSMTLSLKEAADAKRDLENYQDLYESGDISKVELDQYKDILNQKEKAVSDIEDNIEKTRSDLQTELDKLGVSLKSKQVQLAQMKDVNSANMTKQNSSIEASKIDLNIMKDKSVKEYLSDNNIVSNVKNGIVLNIPVINGTRLGVQNVPTKVLQLIDADSIVVSAEVDEEFIKNVVLGETVKIVPESNKDLIVPGTVTRISNVAVEKDGKRIIKVEVKPQDENNILKPGYSADVYFLKQ